jgi:hypothetical protein
MTNKPRLSRPFAQYDSPVFGGLRYWIGVLMLSDQKWDRKGTGLRVKKKASTQRVEAIEIKTSDGIGTNRLADARSFCGEEPHEERSVEKWP